MITAISILTLLILLMTLVIYFPAKIKIPFTGLTVIKSKELTRLKIENNHLTEENEKQRSNSGSMAIIIGVLFLALIPFIVSSIKRAMK